MGASLDAGPGAVTGASSTGAPAELTNLGTVQSYAYLEDGLVIAPNILTGTTWIGNDTDGQRKINTASRLRFHYRYGSFPTGAGSFKPAIRRAETPFTIYASLPKVNTNTGAYGVSETHIDLPADPARAGVQLNARWNHFTNDAGLAPDYRVNGPFIGYSVFVEDLDKVSGAIVGTDYAGSGRATYFMVNELRGRDMERQARGYNLYRQMQIRRGFAPLMLFWVCHGLNDRNNTSQPSLGPIKSTDPDGDTAFADNTYAFIQDKIAFWKAQGWPTDELRFIVMPSHPVSAPDDAELLSYRAAAESMLASLPFVHVIDMTAYPMLVNFTEINGGPEPVNTTTGGYYNGEREHLRYAWNREIIKRALDQVM